ncbi:uncharacterized protein EV422DRAFT_68500 [Fimicolochytrium jonesii]|uniref:uncharacterized protein n=1 Tax=Fimicolochytrium jonesii TaxID=1396493 RepID=UPI0022FE489C|nr:uncharacterized protein EV422DRAFT_68500 [Fimicolochytrium jonesii]KAI8820383.1 hypothetical protein EV422DRAFT_68500 [Fimicolochytrium jonesii]
MPRSQSHSPTTSSRAGANDRQDPDNGSRVQEEHIARQQQQQRQGGNTSGRSRNDDQDEDSDHEESHHQGGEVSELLLGEEGDLEIEEEEEPFLDEASLDDGRVTMSMPIPSPSWDRVVEPVSEDQHSAAAELVEKVAAIGMLEEEGKGSQGSDVKGKMEKPKKTALSQSSAGKMLKARSVSMGVIGKDKASNAPPTRSISSRNVVSSSHQNLPPSNSTTTLLQQSKPRSASTRNTATSKRVPSLSKELSGRSSRNPSPPRPAAKSRPETFDVGNGEGDDPVLMDMDPDANGFAESVDKWTGLMRRAIVADFMTAKSQMLRRQTQLINQAKAEIADHLADVENRLKTAEAYIVTCEAKAVRCENLMDVSLGYLSKKRLISQTGLFFARWRLKYAEERRSRMVMRLAVQHHRRAVARKLLLGWKEIAGTTWRRTVERRVKMEAEKAMESLAGEYDKRIAHLERNLTEVNSRLAISESARAVQEEEMKKAFMRGVCALNMEAMSMFRHPDGGEGDTFLANAKGQGKNLDGGTGASYPPAPPPPQNTWEAQQLPPPAHSRPTTAPHPPTTTRERQHTNTTAEDLTPQPHPFRQPHPSASLSTTNNTNTLPTHHQYQSVARSAKQLMTSFAHPPPLPHHQQYTVSQQQQQQQQQQQPQRQERKETARGSAFVTRHPFYDPVARAGAGAGAAGAGGAFGLGRVQR